MELKYLHVLYPMAAIVDTEVRELRELILSLREETRVGFAQMDTKLVEVKSEIQRVEFEMKSEIKRVESEMKSEIKRVESEVKRAESEMKSEIKRVESEMKSEMQRVESEMKNDFQRMEAKTDVKLAEIGGKIDEVKAELGGKIDVLDERTQVDFWGFIGRALIISALGGGIVFATKFFLTGKPTL